MVANNVQDEVKVLKDDVAKLRSDITDLVDLLREIGLQKVDETREGIEDEIREQREKLRVTMNRAREQGRAAAGDFEQQITDHPIGSLLTAFGIGFILAKLSGGK